MQLAESCQPDVVLMDYKLPNIDGPDTTRRMRELPVLAETVIISISADSEPSVRASAIAAGSNEFLFKPIDFGNLEISLESHLLTENKSMEGFVT